MTALQWSPNGERLALAYSDGSAMVASVDGHRLWHARITSGCPLERVCWRPDGRVLLAASADGAVTAHDARSSTGGQQQNAGAVEEALCRVTLHCRGDDDQGPAAPPMRVAALEWHWSRPLGGARGGDSSSAMLPPPAAAAAASVVDSTTTTYSQRHALLIVCTNGVLQLMRGEAADDDGDDDDGAAVVCVDTGLSAPLRASWAPDGATFAVSGLAPPPASSSAEAAASAACMIPTVQLYTSAGEHLHTFRVDADRKNGSGGGGGGAATAAAAVMPIEGLAWEGANGGRTRARLSLAVGPALLLANVRRPHLWARFGCGGGGAAGDDGCTMIAYAAGGDGDGPAFNSGRAQRLVIADAGGLLAALDHGTAAAAAAVAGAPPLLPRPRVFVKSAPCSRVAGVGGSHAQATIANMASAGDLCALACKDGAGAAAAAAATAAAAAAGDGGAGLLRLALVDAAGEAVATQALPAGASARFLAAARLGFGGEEGGNEDIIGDKEDESDGEEEEEEEGDDEPGAAAAVVAAAGEDGGGVFVWWWRRCRQQQQQQQQQQQHKRQQQAAATCCWGFHVDHLPVGPASQQQAEQRQQQQQQRRPPLCAAAGAQARAAWSKALAAPVQDHITALALNRTGTRLLIGRESGVVAEYALAWPPQSRGRAPPAPPQPVVELRARHLLRCCPSRLEYNSDCSLVAVLSNTGDLSLLALPVAAAAPPVAGPLSFAALAASPSSSSSSSSFAAPLPCGGAPPPPGKHLPAVRHEVWDICWSSDEPLKLAAMEREQLRVLRCPSLEPSDGGSNEEDDPPRRRRRRAEERRWCRGMPHLLDYGSLRVLGLALDLLVAAAVAVGPSSRGGGGGAGGALSSSSSSSSSSSAALASAAADLLASGRAVFVHETEVLRRARALVARAEQKASAHDGGGGGSSSSSSSSGNGTVAQLAAELAALASSSAGGGGGGVERQRQQRRDQTLLHPRLSRLLADHALARGDWAMAERALRACGDYGGVLLARRGALLSQQQGSASSAAAESFSGVAAAEAALLRREFAAAERAYCAADRADLAIAMWQRLGCERRAEALLLRSSEGGGFGGSGGGSSGARRPPASAELTACWHRRARAAAERRRWSRAGKYLALCLDAGTGAGAVAAERDAVRWLHHPGDSGGDGGEDGGWGRLARLATSAERGLPDGSPLLAVLAARLKSAGLDAAAAVAVERGRLGGFDGEF